MDTRLTVLGTGLITGRGRGLAAQASAPNRPENGETTFGLNVCRVAPETLNDRTALKALRRADRFCKMAAIAAWDAASAAGLHPAAPETVLGIIMTTAFGPHRTTFSFLDDILDFGDLSVSPTTFSHSVHNAAAAYLAIMLSSRGPACTVTDFEQPFQAGLRTAALWLREGRCTHALVGYTEEWCDPMETILTAQGAGDKRHPRPPLPPLNLSPEPDSEIGEGSLCLALTLSANNGAALDMARIESDAPIADLNALLRCMGQG